VGQAAPIYKSAHRATSTSVTPHATRATPSVQRVTGVHKKPSRQCSMLMLHVALAGGTSPAGRADDQ